MPNRMQPMLVRLLQFWKCAHLAAKNTLLKYKQYTAVQQKKSATIRITCPSTKKKTKGDETQDDQASKDKRQKPPHPVIKTPKRKKKKSRSHPEHRKRKRKYCSIVSGKNTSDSFRPPVANETEEPERFLSNAQHTTTVDRQQESKTQETRNKAKQAQNE